MNEAMRLHVAAKEWAVMSGFDEPEPEPDWDAESPACPHCERTYVCIWQDITPGECLAEHRR